MKLVVWKNNLGRQKSRSSKKRRDSKIWRKKRYTEMLDWTLGNFFQWNGEKKLKIEIWKLSISTFVNLKYVIFSKQKKMEHPTIDNEVKKCKLDIQCL